MKDTTKIESGHIVFADLPKNKDDVVAFNNLIEATIQFYKDVYGEPKRVWVNAKDVPEELEIIDGLKIERRGGCPRGKVMVM